MELPSQMSTPPHNPSTAAFADKMLGFVNFSRPAIEISLHGQHDSQNYFRTYTSLDKIEGTVTLVAPHDTRFDNIEISFFGYTKTYVDKMGTVSAVNGRSEAFHQFLKLNQPIDETTFPQPRVAQSRRTYKFPFTFVVPNELLPGSCRHKLANEKLKEAHLQLPPSLGDPELAGSGVTLLDDMAPEMSRVSYGIKAVMTRRRDRDGKEITISDKVKKVRIVPAAYEQPPIDIDGQDEEYVLRREKSVRKGLFKGKAGRLVMEAAQPRSLCLPRPDCTDPYSVGTVASVMMRYDPIDVNSQPPKLSKLVSKLRVGTYYASAPRSNFPTKANSIYDVTQGLHAEVLPLSSRCMATLEWQRHEPHTSASEVIYRRGSAETSSSVARCPEPSSAYSNDKPFYTTRLLVPINLPTNKTFVPTFHSCLVSRIYLLDIQLGLPSVGTAAGVGTTIALKIPVQVSAEGANYTSPPESPQEVAMTFFDDQDEQDPLRPRSFAPPSSQYLQTSAIGSIYPTQGQGRPPAEGAPPEYSYIGRNAFVHVSA